MGIILFNFLANQTPIYEVPRYCFRPLMGIILFNKTTTTKTNIVNIQEGFRPLMGIILFNPVFETTGIYWSKNAKNGGDYKSDLKSTLAH